MNAAVTRCLIPAVDPCLAVSIRTRVVGIFGRVHLANAGRISIAGRLIGIAVAFAGPLRGGTAIIIWRAF